MKLPHGPDCKACQEWAAEEAWGQRCGICILLGFTLIGALVWWLKESML